MTKSRLINRRAHLLGGVGMAIIASAPAVAGTATVTQNASNNPGDATGVADAYQTIYSNPQNTGGVVATVSGATGGITRIDSWNGTTLSSTNTLTANTVSAQALGNTFTNTAPLAVLDSEEGSDGITSLGLAVNTGYVHSLVDDTQLAVSLVNTPLDSATNSGNTVSATTAINSGTTSITGSVPSTYSSGASGHVSADVFATTDAESTTVGQVLDSSGSVLASTVQYATGTGASYAHTAGTSVSLTLNADDSEIGTGLMTSSGAASIDANTVKTSYAANSATSTVSVLGGTNPEFAGSAVLDTAQYNNGNVGGDQATTSETSISGSVDSSNGDVNRLSGSLSVANNTVSASTNGNESLGNSLTLSGANLSGAFSGAGSTIDDSEAAANYTADGALVSSVVQYNDGQPLQIGALLQASTLDTAISGYAQEISGGTLAVSGNTISAASRGNTYSDTLGTDGGVNSVSGAVTASSYQLNNGIGIAATVSNSGISAAAGDDEVGGVTNASLIASTNTTSATAYGNQATHDVTLDATSVNTGFAFDGVNLATDLQGITSANGLVTLNNVQSNFDAAVTANNLNSTIRLASDSESPTSSSNLAATGNRQEAVAAGNLATSGVTVSAVSLGGGIGLVNTQMVDATSPVAAILSGSASATTQDDIGTGSTITLADNLERAVAYGSSARNTVDVAATQTSQAFTPLITASILTVPQSEGSNELSSTFGLLNTQVTLANVTATATPVADDASFAVRIGNDVETSTLVNSNNTLVAAAYGASAVNTANVALGNVDNLILPFFNNSVAALANAQYVDLGATVSAQAAPAGTASVLTSVSDEVYESSVSTNGNTVQAQALGNSASNALAATGTSVFVPGISAFATSSGAAVEQSAFGVNNLQVANEGTTFQATLRDSFEESFSSASVLTAVDSEVTASSIVSLDNSLLASAGANSASNLLSVNITSLVGTAGVNNLQGNGGSVSATIGVQGLAGDPNSPNRGGVAIAIGDDIEASTVQVSGNLSAARGVGNEAVNGLSLTSNAIGNFFGDGFAEASAGTTTADYLVNNAQANFGDVTTGNFGTFAITQSSDAIIDNSTLSVTGNTQSAKSLGNLAGNTLTIAATDMSDSPVTAGIGSVQSSEQTTSAVSNAMYFVPAEAWTSSVAISGNTNTALAVQNEVTNNLAVRGANVGSRGGSTANASADSVQGDAVLGSSQQASGLVFAIASSSITNQDATDVVTDGMLNGSLAFNSNVTSAEASANRAENLASVAGTAAQGASVGLSNAQQSSSTVVASATSSTQLALTGYSDPEVVFDLAPFQASSGSISGNTTQALARGNAATNSLTSTAGAVYGGGFGSAPAASNGVANANAVVLNNQGNSGNVQATAINASYSVVLNSGTAAPGVQSSSVSVGGNTASAAAYGNQATNSLTLSSLNSGMTTGSVYSMQQNSGIVSATASNVSYGINAGQGVTNASTFGVSGNAVSAAAVGNSAVSSIIAH